jgi:hypothetical protein
MEIEVVDDRAVLVPKKLVDKSQAYFRFNLRCEISYGDGSSTIKDGRKCVIIRRLIRGLPE